MKSDTEKVILFPRWKSILEQESLEALQQRQFNDALLKLNKLISFGEQKHEIIFGKLICLVELGRYDEAQEICEELIETHNEHYYYYIHMYLTILFQTGQYQLLIEHATHELVDQSLPQQLRQQIQQLYLMSKQMKAELDQQRSTKYIKELKKAVDAKNYVKQWHYIETLRKMKIAPPKEVYEYLINEGVHPVAKTAIFIWLQSMHIDQQVSIHKFGKQLTVRPSEISNIRDQDIMKETLVHINDLEQEDPTLFHMLEELLYRYVYVSYPIIPGQGEGPNIAIALEMIGDMYMRDIKRTDIDPGTSQYIEDITMCEALYLSIIDE